ncbi:hypothetical protein UlMin_039988 [Ulmus minor]
MQATLYLSPPPVLVATATKNLGITHTSLPKLQTCKPCLPLKATLNDKEPTVDYSSTSSVFPAEACETVGGDACDAEIYPEAKLKPEAGKGAAKTASEPVDREYFEYNDPKTVFPGEACDDLGGEFCEPEYQSGVF